MVLNSIQIAVANYDHTIRVYDIHSGGLAFNMSGHTNFIFALCMLNSSHLISGSQDKTIKMWDITTGGFLRNLTSTGKQVNNLLNLNNGLIVAGLSGTSNNMALINTTDWAIKSYLTPGHNSTVWKIIQLSVNQLASGSGDNTTIIWQ